MYLPSKITSKSYIFVSESPLLSLWYFSLQNKTNICSKRMRRLISVSVNYIYQVEDTFHTRSHTNVERFSLWQSHACVLASLARYKDVTVTVSVLELRLAWFKKYHLFPNYTSAFISSFNCLHQRDQNVHTRSRNSPE